MTSLADYASAILLIGAPLAFLAWRIWWTVRITRGKSRHSG
jgi:hypothetical protein